MGQRGEPTRHERELERKVRELEFRTTITTAMLGTLDLDQVLYVILSGITSGEGLGFNRAFLFLSDESGRQLRVKLALGPATEADAQRIWDNIQREQLTLQLLLDRHRADSSDGGENLTRRLEGLSLPMDRLEQLALSREALIVEKRAPLTAVLARCLLNRSPFSSNGLTLVHEVGGAAGQEMVFRNLALVPLVVAGRLIGAILADNRYNNRPVRSGQLRSLHAFGNLAALAIDRARLHAATVAMAEVDGLTGVYNRRYYQQQLGRLLERAGQRAEPRTSIVVFDLDHFKGYNDRLGHLVGDELLKDVARILSDNVRQSDMVARYGGEEFVVVLAETGVEAAAQVAEKLRLRVKETPLAGGKVRGLTLSAGVASTAGGDSVEQLFHRADLALYRAKAAGRDQVQVWSEAEDAATEQERTPAAP